jgi:hypothetical protein
MVSCFKVLALVGVEGRVRKGSSQRCIVYHVRMGDMTRREMLGQTMSAGIGLLASLEAFAETNDRIPAEIEAKIPSAEAIDTMVRDFVRETKGKLFDSNALATRIVGGDRLAGVHAFEGGEGIVERVEQLRLLFAGDTAKMKAVEHAWLTAVATKKVAADADVALMEEIPKYVFQIDGGADAGATLKSALEVRKATLRIALANDVLVKMRDALNRIRVRK